MDERRMGRLVVPIGKRINPQMPIMAFETAAPTLFDRLTGGNPGIDEKTAYLRGLLRGPSPFEMEQPNILNPFNIALLKKKLMEQTNPLQQALKTRAMQQAQ